MGKNRLSEISKKINDDLKKYGRKRVFNLIRDNIQTCFSNEVPPEFKGRYIKKKEDLYALLIRLYLIGYMKGKRKNKKVDVCNLK